MRENVSVPSFLFFFFCLQFNAIYNHTDCLALSTILPRLCENFILFLSRQIREFIGGSHARALRSISQSHACSMLSIFSYFLRRRLPWHFEMTCEILFIGHHSLSICAQCFYVNIEKKICGLTRKNKG